MGRMNNRGVILLTVATVLAVSAYNLRQPREPSSPSVRKASKLPMVDEAPSMRLVLPQHSGIASPEVWDIKPLMPLNPLPSLKEMFKPFYSLSNNGRFQSIQRSDRPNEQWQFQGVVARGDTLRALFYNEALRKLKNLGVGEAIDDQLVIQRIAADRVTLGVRGEKKPLSFELVIFKTNKDLYAVKRKKL